MNKERSIVFTCSGTVKSCLYRELPIDIFLEKFQKDISKGEFSNAVIDEENFDNNSIHLSKNNLEVTLVINEDAKSDLKNGLVTSYTKNIYKFIKLLKLQKSIDELKDSKQIYRVLENEEKGNLIDSSDKLIYIEYLKEQLKHLLSREDIRQSQIEMQKTMSIYMIFSMIIGVIGALSSPIIDLITTFISALSFLKVIPPFLFSVSAVTLVTPFTVPFLKRGLSSLCLRSGVKRKLKHLNQDLILGEIDTNEDKKEEVSSISNYINEVKMLIILMKSNEKETLLEQLNKIAEVYANYKKNVDENIIPSSVVIELKQQFVAAILDIETRAKNIIKKEQAMRSIMGNQLATNDMLLSGNQFKKIR